MGFGTAIFAATAMQAVSQIGTGYAMNAEAKANATMIENTGNYNAAVLEGKANLIDVQNDIEQGQYTRLKGQYLSKSVATIAKQGVAPQGSSIAVMQNAQTQIEIDQEIAKYNRSTEKNYTIAEANEQRRSASVQADALRRGGKASLRSGYVNAFSSLLQGAVSYAAYKIPKSTTFDYSTKTPAQMYGGSDGRYITK